MLLHSALVVSGCVVLLRFQSFLSRVSCQGVCVQQLAAFVPAVSTECEWVVGGGGSTQ